MNKKTKIVLLCLVIFIIIAAAIALFVRNYIEKSKDYIEIFSTPEASSDSSMATSRLTPETTGQDASSAEELSNVVKNKDNIVNILFLGIDRTEDRDETMGVYRTDTIMFASANLNTKKVDILCIPRDSYVYIPVIDKKDKINHAYVWGGMKKEGIKSTIATVNNFIKYEKVDYYFAIDIEPVDEIVDAIGGVEMDVEIDMISDDFNISRGFQLLDGKKASAYIRWRNTGRGDIDRVIRQQAFLKAALDKIKKRGNVMDVINIILKYNKYIQTDLNPSQMLALASFSRDIPEDNVSFYDTPGYGEYIDGISYWIPDEEIVKIFQK